MPEHTAPPGLRIPRSHPVEPRMTPEYYAYTVRLFNDLIYWKGRQLEPPRRPPSWYPGQPEPPRPRPVKPCRCFYGLTRVPDAPGPHVPVTRPGIRRTEWLTRCFVLLFDCPHHGDDALDPEDWVAVVCHAEGQEWPWERILDPEERAGE